LYLDNRSGILCKDQDRVEMTGNRTDALVVGASHDQADAQTGKKSTFQAIHLQFLVMDIVTKSFEMSKISLGIS
jgi:hypothetical protein